MKIVIDARIIRSGTGRYIERLLYYLEELDQSNSYTVLLRKADLDYYKPRNPRFKTIEADFADYSFGEQLGLARLLYSLKPDLVHFCMPQQPLLYVGPTVTSILDLNLIRLTHNDMHPLELRVKKLIFAILLKIVARRSKHIITISEFSRNDIAKFTHIKPEKISVTYPAAEQLGVNARPLPELIGKGFIMYVGRAESYKNNRGLILAHQELLKKHPGLELVIVGKKDKLREADIQWVSEMQFKHVSFLGFVPDDQLAWLYKNCQAYVFPSFMEGFGLPPLEAMLYGAPVAASNASCIPEILGDAAVYFDPSNPEDMTQTIDKLISDKKVREAAIKKGFAQAQKYSWRRMAEQILAVYNEVFTTLPKN